jgi:peptidylprolyl isomerase
MPTAKITAAIAALTLFAAGCGDDKKNDTSASSPTATVTTPTATATTPATPTAKKPKVSVPSGPAPKKLVIKDIKKGTGAAAKSGDQLTVNYVGVLYKTKKQFDASYDRGQPFTLTLGAGQVIPGWDKGLVGMKTGGRRELIIPPADGYGANGAGPIPPNSTLVFVVDLVQIG